MKAQAFKCMHSYSTPRQTSLTCILVTCIYHHLYRAGYSRVLECGVQPAGDNMFLLWLLLADTGDLASLAFSSWLCVSGDLAPVCRGLKVLDMQIHTRVNTCPQLDIYLLTRVRS